MIQAEEDEMMEETVVNRLLLLYTLAQLAEHRAVDKWKIQKTCFFGQLTFQEEGIKTTNYEFFKWDHGPMSSGIWNDCNILEHLGLIRTNRQWIDVTPEGEEFLDSLRELFEKSENELIMDYLDTWIEKMGPFSGKDLKEMSHRLEISFRGKSTSIEDIPKGNTLLCPMKQKDVRNTFSIDSVWLETLETMFSADYEEIKGILSTPVELDDFLSWSEVFGPDSRL